ncbi:hypothetical protein AOQ71_07160 [Bradyrhizobium manausense]|uniref:Error-prone DNA polymerase n=1 Tax=Bradyrhizobium manausense TaxID=989370 RepID=A0A0R3E134_9BRAD|nr:hypothetical protein AOQ71_07160 [Bradyrhizobium manausense]
MEPVVFPKPELEKVLGKTLGVPFSRIRPCASRSSAQASSPAMPTCCESSMATFKSTGGVSSFREKLIQGMVDNGYERDFADHLPPARRLRLLQISGIERSLFCADRLCQRLAQMLASRHLLRGAPECTTLGFYAPAQIVRDAIAHGVDVRPVCANALRWDCTLEPTNDDSQFAVRLGLRMVKGIANAHGAAIVAARADQPLSSINDLWRRAGVPSAALVQLAEADAFRRTCASPAATLCGQSKPSGTKRCHSSRPSLRGKPRSCPR